jgi:hypothetical protein
MRAPRSILTIVVTIASLAAVAQVSGRVPRVGYPALGLTTPLSALARADRIIE